MSWALSCLSLREHYDEVALYTDQEGYDILVNKLHLPYTEVNVVYDKNLCLPHHWAYAKVKTYSMQTKPFLHIDGDVYLPQPIPKDIANAPLIVQNKEVGTVYYRSMMEGLLHYPEITLPSFINKGLAEDSLASYNMGIFGGNDLDFIQRYCKEVDNFMYTNGMNDISKKHSRLNCNIFFEQIILATMADSEGRKVASVYGKPVEDQGYSLYEFCDFWNYEKKQLFHILGGHKRVRINCEQLENTMHRLYPDYFMRVIGLFESNHRRLGKIRYTRHDYESKDYSIAQYEEVRERKANEWDSYSIDEIIKTDKAMLGVYDFCKFTPEERVHAYISIHPYLYIYEIPGSWSSKALEQIKQRFACEEGYPLKGICLFPVLLHNGIKEVPIVDFQQRIISIIKNTSITYRDLEERVMSFFRLKTEKSKSGARKLIYNEISRLIKQGVLIVTK
jgi:hypothetical protein